jgi:hypothetical protein
MNLMTFEVIVEPPSVVFFRNFRLQCAVKENDFVCSVLWRTVHGTTVTIHTTNKISTSGTNAPLKNIVKRTITLHHLAVK